MKLFISQSAVDAWLSSDQAEFRGDQLALCAGDVLLRLTPASLFLSVSGGEADPHRLVGRVKDQAGLVTLGAEGYMTSVLLGETAYDVEPGFVATPVDGALGSAQLFAALRAVGA